MQLSLVLMMSIMCFIEHKNELEKDVTGDTGGHFERMLVVLLQVRSLLKIFKKNKIQDVNYQ